MDVPASRRCRSIAGALLAGFLAAIPIEAVSITRGPYLGRPDDVSLAVVWLTDGDSPSAIEYAADDGARATVSDPDVSSKHVLRLSSLIPGALYRYRVVLDGQPLSDTHAFRAPRDPADLTLHFGVIGDTDGVAVPAEIAARLATVDIDLVLHTGDVVYPGGEESGYDAQYFQPMAPLIASAPVLPTLGNHDILTDRGAPYLDAFVLPANDATGDSRFYAARQGDALFVSVDVESSEFGAGSAQYQWLERTLRDSDALWKFVYLHEPPYSSAESNLAVRFILTPLFESAGVDVVFSGHMHLYERTVAIRNFATAGPGIVYVTEGGGGATFAAFVPQDFSAIVFARYGYLVVDIEGGNLMLTAHDLDGSVFDSLELHKTVPLVHRAIPERIAPPAKHPSAPDLPARP